MNRWILAGAAAAFLSLLSPASAEPIRIMAAENFYGEAAAAIGGDRLSVQSVIVAAGMDPHDFDPPPSVARTVADAKIVIVNGADYDHWMEHLLEGTAVDGQVVINVAELIGVADGDNPHVWYDPAAMPALANALTAQLVSLDLDGAQEYEERRDAFLATLAPVAARVAEVKAQFDGAPVAATEPVFGYMAAAMGLTMQNESFQTAIMNETEPSARDIAAMEDDLRNSRVKVLFTNAQVEDAFTTRLEAIARDASVPVVRVSETQPDGKTYAEWMLDAVEATAKALSDPAS